MKILNHTWSLYSQAKHSACSDFHRSSPQAARCQILGRNWSCLIIKERVGRRWLSWVISNDGFEIYVRIWLRIVPSGEKRKSCSLSIRMMYRNSDKGQCVWMIWIHFRSTRKPRVCHEIHDYNLRSTSLMFIVEGQIWADGPVHGANLSSFFFSPTYS